ncbi:MAG TPA: allantoate amidohydrolase [Caulobacteraceae bacterium]|nr:allantoate amidohydrolase [Caulobacteraceae bacterium]
MAPLTVDLGERPVARCDALGEVPYSEEPGLLSRPYLTRAHRMALDELAGWMTEAGMSVRLDPLGNMIGRYEGLQPGAPALLIGSHIDTVRNGGRYDGALGVMLGVECVGALNRAGRRYGFAIEVIAFGDEEGSRFPASMLCSRGVVAPIELSALETADADGVTVGQALVEFGLDPARIAEAARLPGEVFAYVEAHIEQGPVLESEALPVGVVTGIAAQHRIKIRLTGEAGHAGTTPMDLRRDALAGAAESILAIEALCRQGPQDLRGTVGRIAPKTQAYNVIPGEVELGLDLRAAAETTRDAACEQIRAKLALIARDRGLQLDFQIIQTLPASPCDAALMRLMNQAVADIGVRPFELISGAGHDAMVLARLAPMAMLFIRCAGGVSHNPAERVAPEDVAVAGQTMIAFIERLAAARA